MNEHTAETQGEVRRVRISVTTVTKFKNYYKEIVNLTITEHKKDRVDNFSHIFSFCRIKVSPHATETYTHS